MQCNTHTSTFSLAIFPSLLLLSYRTQEEIQKVRKGRDPIKLAEDYIAHGPLAAPEELKVRGGRSKEQGRRREESK